MKRVKAVTVVVALALLTSSIPTAGAQQLGNWNGATSQGFPMNFVIVEVNGAPVIRSWGFNFQLTCKKSGRIENVGMGFFNFDPPIVNNQFSFQYLGFFDFFEWSGTFISPSEAKGTASTTWAALRPELRTEKCKSKRVTWQAQPGLVLSSPMDREGLDYVIEVTKDTAGAVQVNIKGR